MTAKQYLKQAYRLNELIDSDLAELEGLRLFASSISSPNLSGMPSSGTRGDAAYTKSIAQIIGLESKIKAEVDAYIKLKDAIRGTINTVPDGDEKLLLKLRYINFLTWEEIGDKLNVSQRTVHRIHAEALKNLNFSE